MASPLIGPFSLEAAKRAYEELGPLTQADVYSLLPKTDKRRRESLQRIYGRYGAEYALVELKRLVKAL